MFNIFLLRFILAGTYTVGKAIVCVVKPLFFVGAAMTLAGCLLLYWCWTHAIDCSIKKEDRKQFLQLAVYQVYLPYAIDFYIAQYISSTKWALIHSATPFVTAILSWILFNELLTVRKSIGLSIGVVGILSLFIYQTDGSVVAPLFPFLPELIVTFSMIIYSYSWIAVRPIASRYNILFINSMFMLLGGLLAFISSILCESCLSISPVLIPSLFIVLIFIKVFIVIVGFPLYTYLLTKYSVTFLAFSSFLEPLFVALFGWALLSETISVYFMSAFIALTLGLYIFYTEELVPTSLSIKE